MKTASHKVDQQHDASSQSGIDTSKKTTGEKAYDVFQFMVGKVFIIAVTALFAFESDTTYASKKYFGKVTNPLRWLAEKLEGWLEPLKKGSKSNKYTKIAAGAISGMVILSHGGNFFAPVIKWLENGREKISNYFNRTIGKPGEEEIAHERLKDLPKQNWWDIIKGRIGAWMTAFTVLGSADLITQSLWKTKPGEVTPFGKYEEVVGRKAFTWMTKEGREIFKKPLKEKLSVELAKNKVYRFGKVFALDFYATTAAILVWNSVSRMSAKKRVARNHDNAQYEAVTDRIAAISPQQLSAIDDAQMQPDENKDQPSDKFSERFSKTDGSHTKKIERQQEQQLEHAVGM